MKRQSILVILIVALFIVIPSAPESAYAVLIFPREQDIVNQVSQTTYSYYLDEMLYTHLGDNRE